MTTTINNTTTTNNNVTMNAPASATSAVVNTTINTAAVTPNLKDPDLVDFTLDGAEAQYKAGEYDKLLAQCKQDAANTKWLEEGIRDIRFEASHDEPLCADEYAKQMKVSEEAVLDTQQNAGLNLTTCIGKKPVGDSAVRSICDRGMIGMNCYELLRKERRESLKEVLNLILAERKGAVQVKYSYDKVRAVHSARYAAIGNDKLLKIMDDYMDQNWPDREFEGGYLSHELMKVVIDLGAYKQQFFRKLPSGFSAGYTPAVMMISSDVAASAVRLIPCLNMGSGIVAPMAKDVAIPHIGEDIAARVTNAFVALLAYFDDAATDLDKLRNVLIRNSKAALVRVLKSGGMPKQEALEALEGFDAVYGDMPVTALDIYLAVCDAYAGVVRNHTQDAKKIFAAADCVARCARTRWSDVDMPGKSHRNLLTSGVASCYPFISFEMQDPGGVMVGTNHVNNSLVTIDMFDTRAHANANAVILGSSGYGKTFTAQLFALRLSEMDTQVFIISPLKGLEDYGGGCKAVNGQFVSMDPSSDNNINIMDIRAPDDEDAKLLDDYEASGSFLTKKIHTILSFLHLVVRNMTQEEEQLIDGCLYATYAKFGITRDNNSIYDKDGNYKVMPLLEDLQEEMRKNPELHTVCNILNPLINGSMACFNHHTNVDLDSKYIVFDFNGMKGSLLTMSMFVVLDFVWTKIKEDRTQRKAVFIDECWKLIGTDSNEQAAEDVVEIFRTIRAYGGSAFAMTQDISQFYEYKGGKYGKAIIGNADTKIIMHLIPSEAKALQEAIQLTSVEMEAVSSLPRGQRPRLTATMSIREPSQMPFAGCSNTVMDGI